MVLHEGLLNEVTLKLFWQIRTYHIVVLLLVLGIIRLKFTFGFQYPAFFCALFIGASPTK